MNGITRGVRNALRNKIRTFSIIIIVGLSIGLTLSMLVARQTVSDKIASVKANVGKTDRTFQLSDGRLREVSRTSAAAN